MNWANMQNSLSCKTIIFAQGSELLQLHSPQGQSKCKWELIREWAGPRNCREVMGLLKQEQFLAQFECQQGRQTNQTVSVKNTTILQQQTEQLQTLFHQRPPNTKHESRSDHSIQSTQSISA